VLIDLVIDGEDALVVGQGREAEFKIMRALDAGARVTAVGARFSGKARKAAAKRKGRARLVTQEPDVATVMKMEEEVAPKVVFISTEDESLDEALVEALRRGAAHRPLICVVDRPRFNDFNMPALGRVGDIRVAVSTGGRSPAMAARVRDKVERVITKEDVLQVRLQADLRGAVRRRLKDHESRREFVRAVLGDKNVSALMRAGRYDDAKRRAEAILETVGKPRQS
jgi:siroheme synthase-like protein